MFDWMDERVKQFESFLGSPWLGASPLSHHTSLAYDEQEAFPTECVSALKARGYCDYFVPKQWGGRLNSLSELYCLSKAVASRDLTVAVALGVSFLGALPLWIGANDRQKKRLADGLLQGKLGCFALTEKEHGSDVLANEVHASGQESWVINGTKWCINHATLSDTVTIMARTHQQGGVLGFGVFFIDKANLSQPLNYLAKLPTHGVRGLDISGFELNEVALPKDALVGRANQGFEQVAKTLQVSRTLCAAFSLGGATHALSAALGFADKRRLYQAPLIEIAAVRQRLARCYCLLLMMEVMSLTVIRAVTLAPDKLSVWSAICKFFVPEYSEHIIKECKTLIGARAYLRTEEYAIVQKIHRDNEVIGLFDGCSDVNLSIIAGSLGQQATMRGDKACFNEIDLNALFDFSNAEPPFTGAGLRLAYSGLDEVLAYILSDDELIDDEVRKALRDFDETILAHQATQSFDARGLQEFGWAETSCWFFTYACMVLFLRHNQNNLPAHLSGDAWREVCFSEIKSRLIGDKFIAYDALDKVSKQLLERFHEGKSLSIIEGVS